MVRIGSGKTGYRTYQAQAAGENNGLPDGNFVDWGLAVATARILNAVLNGTLVI